MEELLKPLVLLPEASTVLDEMRQSQEPTALFGLDPKLCDQTLRQITEPLLMAAGLPLTRIDHYRWFVREVGKFFRNKTCPELAFYLELCMRKWVNYGLETNTMQLLLCEIHKHLKQMQENTAEITGDSDYKAKASPATQAEKDNGKEKAKDPGPVP